MLLITLGHDLLPNPSQKKVNRAYPCLQLGAISLKQASQPAFQMGKQMRPMIPKILKFIG